MTAVLCIGENKIYFKVMIHLNDQGIRTFQIKKFLIQNKSFTKQIYFRPLATKW